MLKVVGVMVAVRLFEGVPRDSEKSTSVITIYARLHSPCNCSVAQGMARDIRKLSLSVYSIPRGFETSDLAPLKLYELT